MENGINGHSGYSEKRFHHYEIDWTIENFCVATCGDEWEIHSPEFTVKGLRSSTWVLILRCKKSHSNNIVKLVIKRSMTDTGPETIWVDWRCCILGFPKEFGSDSLMNACDKGMGFGLELGIIDDLINKFNIFESDSLTIRSNFIFFSEEDQIEFPEKCTDSTVQAFADALLQLFRTKVLHDLKLKFEDDDQGTRIIPVHKVVVCSRIKELNFLLEKSGIRTKDEKGECDVIDLSFLNFDAMVYILKYTYSGNLKFVFESPTFDIYDCVHKLRISELKPFFNPNKLFFKTSVDSQEFNFTWIIPDVSDLLKRETVSSPLFVEGCSDKIFQIHFASKRESYGEFYSLHIQSKERDGRQNACFECAITNENNSLFITKRLRISTEDTKMYGFDNYVSRNMVMNFADNLRIITRLRLSSGLTSSCIEKCNFTFMDCITSDKSLELLQKSIQSAYDNRLFTDKHILVSDTSFNLHNSILYARCAKLYILANQDKGKTETHFAKTKPRIFHMLIKYLYSGIVHKNENEADVTDLYELATNLHLLSLKGICSTFMKDLMEDNLSIRDKVAKIIEKHKDNLLEPLKQYFSDDDDDDDDEDEEEEEEEEEEEQKD